MNILEQQYTLICSSRTVMLNFINGNLAGDINKPVHEFSGKTVGYLLAHITDVYKFWLGEFCLIAPQIYTADADDFTIDLLQIHQLFADVNNLVIQFTERYANALSQPISGTAGSGKLINATPLELFTHATTHEFHHKGQIMSMCRLLGKIPPDTDVIRT